MIGRTTKVLALAMLLVGAPLPRGSYAFETCGVLVGGIECVLFQVMDGGIGPIGGRYLLSDDGGFQVGDHVCVSGEVIPFCVSICMEGNGCVDVAAIEPECSGEVCTPVQRDVLTPAAPEPTPTDTPIDEPTPMLTCTTDEDCGPPERCRSGVCVPPRECDDKDPEVGRVNCRGDRESCVDYSCRCGGDCDLDGLVLGTEISRMVCILSGDEACPLSACPPGDFDQDGEIVGSEACKALTNLGYGCPGEGLPLDIPRDLSEDERHLVIGSATGLPGGDATIDVSLSAGQEVATVQMDILFDTDVLEMADPATACSIAPDLNLSHVAFNFLPQIPISPPGMARLRIFVADLTLCQDDLSSLLDSFRAGPLASCDFKIKPGAPVGTSAIAGARPNIGDMRGNEFPVVVDDGAVTVGACVDDTDCPHCLRCADAVCRPRCDGAEGCWDDCPDDMVCGNGLCFEPECTTPADCNPLGAPLRQTCVKGFCVCTGDCNDDENVFGNEITLAVRILGGDDSIDVCEAADANQDGEVFANEVTRGVINLGEDCLGQ
jgi:hypothetical protein